MINNTIINRLRTRTTSRSAVEEQVATRLATLISLVCTFLKGVFFFSFEHRRGAALPQWISRLLVGTMVLPLILFNSIAFVQHTTALTGTVVIETAAKLWEVAPHYLSFTIDSSDERGFFKRDLDNRKLQWLAAQLTPAILRVGGSGGDQMYYDVPHNASRVCPGPPFIKCKVKDARSRRAAPSPVHCLNTSHWNRLHGFVNATGVDLTFGLNFFLNPTTDPSVAALLKYSIEQNYVFYALEFGNEQITGIDIRCLYQQVHGGVALYDMAHRLWPDDKRGPTAKRNTRRPRIMGPDAAGIDPDYVALMANTTGVSPGLRQFAYTYHQYEIGSANTTAMYPGRLMPFKEPFGKFTALQTAQGHGANITTPGPIELWTGEAGGAGGGGVDGVTNSFASGVWYLDALGLYAQARHSVFVRQDFVGAYYGLVEDGCPFVSFSFQTLCFRSCLDVASILFQLNHRFLYLHSQRVGLAMEQKFQA